MLVYSLSNTKLSLMVNCERCFWLEMQNLWHRPRSIFPSLMSGMDLILKTHFDRFRGSSILPPELDSIDGTYTLFQDKKLLSEWRDARRGIRWKDAHGNVLMGAVDELLQNEGKLVVLDFKTTGFPVKNDSDKYYRNQLNIYSFLLQKNGYEVEQFAYLLFYVPNHVTEQGSIVFDTSLIRVKTDTQAAEQLFNRAIALLHNDCPDKKCEWCMFVVPGQKSLEGK